MSKRGAEKQLTLENFEDDEDYSGDERTDGPQLASHEVLKRRPMAKAKRRSDLNSPVSEISTTTDQKSNAFSSFAGFKGFGTKSTALSAFQSLTPLASNATPFKTLSATQSPKTNGSAGSGVNNEKTEDSDDLYNNKLFDLNKCFSNHIKHYMIRSDYYDFSQVCKEYIQYHKKIEVESKPKTDDNKNLSQPLSSDLLKSSQTEFKLQSTFSFPTSTTTPVSSLSSTTPVSSLSSSSTLPSSQASTPDESLFAKPNIQFSFAVNKPITGGTGIEASSAGTDNTNEEESEEPPKVESVEHKESDSVYTKKCKLFFKKGDEFATKGIGYLYIKKAPNATSAELLIRADNRLGNILLHITLNESLPIVKAPQNKGVLFTCIPNPPLDPKAKTQSTVTFLIKVKAADIDQLLNNLNKYKSI